jgi:hypothetical protein
MVIQPGGTSVGGTAGTSSSAAIAIPPLANGANPKWVYLASSSRLDTGYVVLFGQSDVAASTGMNGIGFTSAAQGIFINVAGNTHYRIIAAIASSDYTMTPLSGINPGG